MKTATVNCGCGFHAVLFSVRVPERDGERLTLACPRRDAPDLDIETTEHVTAFVGRDGRWEKAA